MSERQVWLISSGEYSDYRVAAVADTEGAAQRLVDALNDMDGLGYFPFEVDDQVAFVDADAPLDVVDELVVWVSLQLGTDGTIIESPSNNLERHERELRVMSTAPRCQVRLNIVDRFGLVTLTFSVRGTDHERVRKVLSERRARYLSSPAEWPRIVDWVGRPKIEDA